MGWTISHGTNRWGIITRSYSGMAEFGQQLAHILPGAEWRTVAVIFNRGSGDPFSIPPKEAARMATVLRKAGNHRLMSRDWAPTAHELADAADRAAVARQPWEWS